MSSIHDGAYTLRFVGTSRSSPLIGGMYATRDGELKPIATAANTPSFASEQTWWLSSFGQGQWAIMGMAPFPHSDVNTGPGPVMLGFSNDAITDGTPVTYSVAGGYTLIPQGGGIYAIAPERVDPGRGPWGVDYCVGVSEKGTLEIQAIPVIEHEVAPGWLIRKASALPKEAASS